MTSDPYLAELCSRHLDSRLGRFARADLEDLARYVVDESAGYDPLNRGSKGLYLHGPVGVGKTHAAAAIVKHHIEKWWDQHRFTLAWMGTIELFHRLRERFDGGTGLQLSNVLDADILVLDDLGKEKPTDWSLQTLYQVVDSRYTRERPTIYTSNWPPGELAKHYASIGMDLADSITSRIIETTIQIRLTGKDRRVNRPGERSSHA